MNVAWYSLLAQEVPRLKVPWVLIVVVLVVLYVITQLVKRAKAWAEREQARQQEEQLGRRSASAEERRRPQEAGAREAMSALREILGVEPEVSQQPPQAAPPPVIRPVAGRQQQPTPRPATGEGVRREVGRLRDDLAAKGIETRRRLRRPERLRTTIAPASGSEAGREVRVGVDLDDRREAVKAILYSEILGPPKALRRGPESWER